MNDYSKEAVEKFIIPRVKKSFDYLKFIDIKNMFFACSILTKNKLVQKLIEQYYKNKNVKFIEFEDCFKKIGNIMEFIRCKNLNELSRKVAENFKKILSIKNDANLGLATGSSPIETYKILINMFKNKEISFKKASTFNLDEYVGLAEKYKLNSYRYFMDKNFFEFIDINKNNTYFPIEWNQEIDLNKEDYSEYDTLIQQKGGLDLLILGIGNNGHIGFNEPGSDINSKTKLTQLTRSTIEANSRFFENVCDVPKYAVSMGLDTILKANKIVVLVVGKTKRDAFEKLLSSKTFDKNWPCTALIEHKNTIIYYIE